MKYFFKQLNPVFFFGFSYIFVVLQATLLDQVFGIYKPSLVLILISYWALSRYAIEGAILSFLAGYVLSIHSSSPPGLFPCLCVMTYFTVKGISLGVLIHSMIGEMGFVVLTSLIFKIFFLIMMSMVGTIYDLGSIAGSGIVMAFSNFLLTPILFFFFKVWDEWTEKIHPSKTGVQETSISLG